MYIIGRNFDGRCVRNFISAYFLSLRKWNMKSVSIFNITTVEFSLFLPLSFSPCSCIDGGLMVVLWWYYGGLMVVLWLFYVYKSKSLFNFFLQYKLKKIQRTEVQRESMRKKKRLFYDSRKSISTKKIFAVQVFFLFSLLSFFRFLRINFNRFHRF